jgi:hypothetical protein
MEGIQIVQNMPGDCSWWESVRSQRKEAEAFPVRGGEGISGKLSKARHCITLFQ